MNDIPQVAIDRLAKLRRMLDLARAQAEGLQSKVEDARRQLEAASLVLQVATRVHHRLVTVGDDGLAYDQHIRQVDRRPADSAATYVLTGTAAMARAPTFDSFAKDVFDAKNELAEAMERRRSALERVAAVRTATEGVEQALRGAAGGRGRPPARGLAVRRVRRWPTRRTGLSKRRSRIPLGSSARAASPPGGTADERGQEGGHG
jgi:hypothetical protein